jgi:hypothetical protein
MKKKIDKERDRQFENILFSSLRKFNALQIKPLCFNCFTKGLSKHTFSYIYIKKHGHVSQF